MSVEFSVITVVLLNSLCCLILQKIEKKNMLEEPVILPPIGIITLILKPLKLGKKKERKRIYIIDHLKVTNEEYEYLIKRVTPEELDTLLHEPANYKEKKQMVSIKLKYLSLYRYDLGRL